MDDIKRAIHDIQHTLVALNAKHDASDAKMDRLSVKVDSVDARVTMVDDAIRGNGKPGLRSEHQSLEQRVDSLSSILRWVLSVGTALILALVSWAASQIFRG